MELIHKNDVEILDYIIDQCLNGTIRTQDLKQISNIPMGDVDFIMRGDYERYCKIISNAKVAEINFSSDNDIFIYPIRDITKRFSADGGFKKVYEDQQEEICHQNIIRSKELNEAKLVVWHKNTYWITFFLAIAGIIISIIALITANSKH